MWTHQISLNPGGDGNFKKLVTHQKGGGQGSNVLFWHQICIMGVPERKKKGQKKYLRK